MLTWAILAMAVTARCKAQDTTLEYRFHEKDVASLVIEVIDKPPSYFGLWQDVAACNGQVPVISYDSTHFALVHAMNGFMVAGKGPFIGYTLMKPGENNAVILIMKGWQHHERLVKHEMLHAQLGPLSDAHPVDASARCHLW